MIILLIALIGKLIVHFAKYFIFGLFALWLLFGCACSESTDNPSDDVIVSELYERTVFPFIETSDTLGTITEYSIRYFADVRGDKALTAKMNQSVIDSVFFGYYTLPFYTGVLPEGYVKMTDIRDAIKAHSLLFHTSSMLNGGWEGYYNLTHREDEEDWTYDQWYYSVETDVMEAYKNYLSYDILTYHYTGGAHGHEYRTTIVFNLDGGEVVKLDDIVPSENRERLLDLLKTESTYTNNPEEDGYDLVTGYSKDEIPGYFLIDSNGITWYTQPYQYGPWGVPLALTWNQLKGVVINDLQP